MPQPDSTRSRSTPESWSEPSAGWPLDPAAPRRSPYLQRRSSRPRRHPAQDARHTSGFDANEEIEPNGSDALAPSSRALEPTAPMEQLTDAELEDTGRWVAARAFTLEDELEDTWPNLPPIPHD